MTPAERASVVAFALKNCAIEAMTPSEPMLAGLQSYEDGDLSARQLVQFADEYGASHRDAVLARTVWLADEGWDQCGGLDELISIHKRLYSDVFDDAGQLRTEQTARRCNCNVSFFPADFIEMGATNIASEMADMHEFRGLDRDDLIQALAHIYDELGYLHPFVGGNAAVLRIFISRLTHFAGWDLDWGTVTRDEYEHAKHLAYNGDTSGFYKMFDRIARPANLSRIFLVSGWDQGPAH
ncbi:toxin-antitoxin system, toxin component, Fic family [Bifidobacterium dolichotidis]|uniref:protein adenylyltransferase n=1 Tax=Bifidobacterium dolichotidis TaxID=2306976 RepID=A0A430FS92_9BIFI|nr:Fic family protein [Bifidobacterium dolichotidis]RSX55762.1 toxin-antitoxin system, toxin component, Fic family [Bifidobacterium dolichotidis]